MSYGFRVKDAVTGAVTLEVTDRITRVVGNGSTGQAPGSVTVPAGGSAWYQIIPSNPYIDDDQEPIFTINGPTISWTWYLLSGNKTTRSFIYGVY